MMAKKSVFFSGVSYCRQNLWGNGMKTLMLLLLLVLFGTAPGWAETLMLGHTVPPSHVWHKVAEKFADGLSKSSDGKMEVKISPLSKLGNEAQMMSMLQSGAIAFSILPAGVLSNREESIIGWFLPYLFQDVSQAGIAASLPPARQMLKNLESHGIIGLGYMFAGMRHVISVKPVKSPHDLVNKKIRAFPSSIFNDWWKENGAAPTALSLGDIAPSLTTNLLDAVDVDLDIVVGLKFYQQAPYLALTNHMAFPGILIASKKWWDSLSEKEQNLVATVYQQAEQWGINAQTDAEATNLQILKTAGVEVTNIDIGAFKTVGSKITGIYTGKNELIDSFYQQAKETIK